MAKQESLKTSECPVARTLEAIGDRWSLMIIRDAFDDIRRFSEFRKSLGLAKNILSSRLRVLVDLDLFDVQPASDGSAYKEYVLTDKGRSIFPIVVGMRQWGERYMFKEGEIHSILVDNDASQPVELIEVRSSKGRKIEPQDCHRRQIIKKSA